jgi:osmoprotectant transport system substrate-binding protein
MITHTTERKTVMSRKKWRSVMIVGILAALTAALMVSATAVAAPKAGPTVIVGSKNFTEEYILGELYSQALKAKGFSVKYKQSIGATEVIDSALTSGKINIYPEYVGEIDQTVFHQRTLPKTARGWWQLAVKLNKKRGITVLNPTPFFDVDAIAVRTADAKKYGLVNVADLKKVPNASVGARPEFKDREEGFKGMQDVYGLTKMKYVSLDQGLTYQALDQKKVFSIDVFSTDPQLASGKYVVLSDPKLIFGVQNVAPEVSNKLLTSLGSQAAQFKSTINGVSAKLSQKAILAMNSAVVNNKQTPHAVASAFLKANGLG